MLAEELIDEQEEASGKVFSLNRSYLCLQIIRELLANPEIEPLPELTLDLDEGITPAICAYPKAKIKPNFLRDISRFGEMPILAIEVISAGQNIQDLLEQAEILVTRGVKAVWTIEPFSGSIFVTDSAGEKVFYNQAVESEGVKVDFKKIFG